MGKYKDRKDVDNNWIGTKREDDMRGMGGDDTMSSLGGNDYLFGGDGDDTLFGGDGSDYLRGDQGTDHLYGGAGADRFEFIEASGSTAAYGIDTLHDFSLAEGDRIYLGSIIYDRSTGDIPPIYLVSEPTGTRDEITLTYDSAADTTIVNFYVNDGDVVADLTFYVAGQLINAEGFHGVQDAVVFG